ncbi:MAG: hypothetical protein FWB96_02225 [Defluviitaleaceae bacterium]|nr:hypothetical protein [Defluviitaleaceae bacterium]MCL2262354.1 hypothetical protein [Defluviitaleaceae bacterium]
MIIQAPTGLTNRRDRSNGAQNATAAFNFVAPGENSRDIARRLQENQNNMLKEAHNRIQEQQQEQRRQRRPRRQGSVRLSNTDSLGRAHQIRARLQAKLAEIHGSDMEERSRSATAMDIKLKIDRVDRQIAAIRRRERAIQEEKTTRRDDSKDARRRRARDMQERRIYVRRDFLYHANNGGFDPNNPLFNKTAFQNAASSIAFDIGGNTGTMDIAATASFESDFNMEVVL